MRPFFFFFRRIKRSIGVSMSLTGHPFFFFLPVKKDRWSPHQKRPLVLPFIPQTKINLPDFFLVKIKIFLLTAVRMLMSFLVCIGYSRFINFGHF